jgi:hypothetical protein
VALLIPPQTRMAAFVMLAFNFIYFQFVLNLDWTEYYHYSATLCATIGVILYRKYKLVALLSFLLIPVNIIGYLLCKNYFDPYIYDNMCLTITLLQVVVLLSRGLTNGISWGNKRNPLVFLADFDSRKNHAKM